MAAQSSRAVLWGHPLSSSGVKSPLLLSQGMSRNLTQEGQRAGASGEGALQDLPGRENCSRLLSTSLADIESSLQRDAEAAYIHSEVQLRVTAAARGHSQPWGVSWMWPLAWADFLLAGVTLLMCLPLQPVCLAQPSCCWEGMEVGAGGGCCLGLPPSHGAVGFRGQRWLSRLESVMSLRGRLGSAGKLGAFD